MMLVTKLNWAGVCTAAVSARPAITAAATSLGPIIRTLMTKSKGRNHSEEAGSAPAQPHKPMDGNEACVTAAYSLSDQAFCFPITPATPMSDAYERWGHRDQGNVFGRVPAFTQMQSEGGVAGAMHGALKTGSLATTFTASQGLALMIPDMYKMAGELLPGVIHVASRVLFSEGGSMFADHGDVMACRQTGFAMLASGSPQEAHDMAAIAHASALKGSIPFLHFFDGFRVSHEINTVRPIPGPVLESLVDKEALDAFHRAALNPEHPTVSGTAQGADVYMQMAEASNPFYRRLPGIVQGMMDALGAATGREYRLFDYDGHPDAERVVVIMGCGAKTVRAAAQRLASAGEKVGVVTVRLFRPFSGADLLGAIPPSARAVTVLERSKEPGSMGEPLFLDVASSLAQSDRAGGVRLLRGRFGLGSKEFTPAMARDVYDNMSAALAGDAFHRELTVGIADDVTKLSLPLPSPEDNASWSEVPAGTQQAIFWGMGADGTVGACKTATKAIVDEAGMHAQGYFSYSAHKSGNVTRAHMRFGPEPIEAPYLIASADYVACHHPAYLTRYSTKLIDELRPGGAFVTNTPWGTLEEMSSHLPSELKHAIAAKDIALYNIDAGGKARELGLGPKINVLMTAAFFHLSSVMPRADAVATLKRSVAKEYADKGAAIVDANLVAVDKTLGLLRRIDYDRESWLAECPSKVADAASTDLAARVREGMVLSAKDKDFVRDIVLPMMQMEGNSLPVSRFRMVRGGTVPVGTSKYEKRGISDKIAKWDPNGCTQCNMCSVVCPHSAIRPFLLLNDTLQDSPVDVPTLKARGGKAMSDYRYTLQVSPLDCTGCQACVNACPQNVISLADLAEEKEQATKWAWTSELPSDSKHKYEITESITVAQSQFLDPLLEFSGACSGCGQTPYVKLLTQLFGSEMMIANATGCSSIWASTFPLAPYTVDERGRGPAWSTSLFEDNAEFGYGMHLAMQKRRRDLYDTVRAAIDPATRSNVDAALAGLLDEWVGGWDDFDESRACAERIQEYLKDISPDGRDGITGYISTHSDLLAKKSQWIIGGDGWAYDIGYGGLDHVLASGEDVNVLVLDTEVYSNTGGQTSKATPRTGAHSFSSTGKRTAKKDLARIAMTYENVYVATVASGASQKQLLQAFMEAQSYPGPSLIIAYATCGEHGLTDGMACAQQHMALGVKSGYLSLLRYDPRRQPPLRLDSKPNFDKLDDLFSHELRFGKLSESEREVLREDVKRRHRFYKAMASYPADNSDD